MRLKHTVSKKHKNRTTHNTRRRNRHTSVGVRRQRIIPSDGLLSKNTKTKRKVRFSKVAGGGCGCESNSPVSKFFIGGNGGVTTNALLALPANNYYPLNDYSKDPNYLVVSSGQTGNFVRTGGSRRRKMETPTRRRNSQKPRTVKGGGFVSDASALLTPAISATMVGASSYGLGGTTWTPPPYTMYNSTNPPPSA